MKRQNRNQWTKHWEIRPRQKNELKVSEIRKRPSLRADGWQPINLIQLSLGYRVQRRKQFFARSQQQKQQQQWRHGGRNSSSSWDHVVPPSTRTTTNLSVWHSVEYIDRSLSPRLASFPPCQRGVAWEVPRAPMVVEERSQWGSHNRPGCTWKG